MSTDVNMAPESNRLPQGGGLLQTPLENFRLQNPLYTVPLPPLSEAYSYGYGPEFVSQSA